jgi:capsular polysaccharide biosynthesis protein
VAARPLVDEALVRARFEARGFTAVHPERLSLDALRSLLAGASHVAGGYGSAWLNLAFCQRKPACMVLAPDYYGGYLREVSMWLGGMAAPFGLLLGQHEDPTARRLRDATWRLDPEMLEAAIDRFLAWEAG